MSLILPNISQEVARCTDFIQATLAAQHKQKIVIAVSGGIDSALSLTLATQAMGAENVFPVLLPYRDQSTENSRSIIEFNHIPSDHVHVYQIETAVAAFQEALGLTEGDRFRLGNCMARVRMIMVYDLAKKLDALVCGTENKSEHYLGYFTRFGDAASDLEPISHLYKTQVRQLAEFLKLPSQIIAQAPTAGLWAGQTDEAELGFTYREADLVLYRWLDLGQQPEEILIPGVTQSLVGKVTARVKQMQFKQEVPYTVKGNKETAWFHQTN